MNGVFAQLAPKFRKIRALPSKERGHGCNGGRKISLLHPDCRMRDHFFSKNAIAGVAEGDIFFHYTPIAENTAPTPQKTQPWV